jgi:phospholipid-binding lipoprotein MlaA
MPAMKNPAGIAVVVLVVTLVAGGCANQPPYDPVSDPLEPVNRVVYRFNDTFDRYLLKPVAENYQDYMPGTVRSGVRNFFANLHEPLNFVNDVLQGKPEPALRDLMRFVFNSTFGVLGLIDVAAGWELPANREDFGQTFATWGFGEGWYIVLPFLGPSTVRDTFGLPLNWRLDPVVYQQTAIAWTAGGVRAVSDRADLLGASTVLEETAVDGYISLREAYRQARWSQLHDGDPPEPDFFDEIFSP